MLNAVFKRGRKVAAGVDYALSKTNHKGELRAVAPRVLYAARFADERSRAGKLVFAKPDTARMPGRVDRVPE